MKLWLTLAVNGLFWSGYALLSRNAFFPLRTPPRLWLDDVIPYQPEPWAWVYLSQFVASGLLPWLINERETLWRYVRGLVVMCGVSFAVFFIFPVASPRVSGVEVSGAMRLIGTYDGALNAFPSLHAGFLIYLALLARRVFPASWTIGSTLAVIGWGAAILYATIATRQHYAVDLLAGAALGALADWLVWRRPAGVRAATTMSRSSGVAFQDGCR